MRDLCHRIIGRKNDLPNGSARRSWQTFREYFNLASLFVETGNKEVIELVRIDAEDRLFLCDQAFIHHLQRHAHSG